MHSDEIWRSSKPAAIAARIALAPLSGLYAIGWEAYLAIYRLGIKRPYVPRIPVVCVGNLTTGGSGKSPISVHLIELLSGAGRAVVVSCSGYGGPRSEAATLAPDGPLDPQEWGDEPAMIRWLAPHVPIIVGRRRPLAAQIAEAEFPDSILLMDDGFQHLPLKIDLSIILDDPNPVNRMCLPAGPYREGRWNRRRASIVLPREFRVQKAEFEWRNGEGESVDRPARANVLCAIGTPQGFFDDLRNAGIELVRCEARKDHDPLTAGNLWSGFEPDAPIVVTAKDWIKLRRRDDVAERDVMIAMQRRTIEPADAFANWFLSRIDEIREEKSAR